MDHLLLVVVVHHLLLLHWLLHWPLLHHLRLLLLHWLRHGLYHLSCLRCRRRGNLHMKHLAWLNSCRYCHLEPLSLHL